MSEGANVCVCVCLRACTNAPHAHFYPQEQEQIEEPGLAANQAVDESLFEELADLEIEDDPQ